jgi:glycosyltransferase involved in cell wall biosynthesis
MDAPLVTVIMIFWNSERFLAEAVESVVNQSLADWQLLLVDDGSEDSGTAMAHEWAKRDARIHYLEHEGHQNRGMSATRNRGLEAARGRYVAFIDSDDVWLPNKLEEQIALLDRWRDAAMVFGLPLYWNSWDSSADQPDRVPEMRITVDHLYRPPELALALYPLGGEPAPCPSDICFRRELIDCVGGFENHFTGARQMYEDQGFLSKVYLHAPVFISGSTWTRYRLHSGSYVATTMREGRYAEVRRYFLTWYAGYLRDSSASYPAVERRVRHQLLRCRYPRITTFSRSLRRLAAAVGRLMRGLAAGRSTRG